MKWMGIRPATVIVLVLGTWVHALVNLGFQPLDLVADSSTVLVLRAEEPDGDKGTVTCRVMQVCKGKFAPESIVVSAPAGSAEPLLGSIRGGQTLVAFIKRQTRNQKAQTLLYAGNRVWHEGMVDLKQPVAWSWTRLASEGLIGTFNGDADRFAEMMADMKAGTMFFPARPLVGFEQDVPVGKLPGAGFGIMVLDLDFDGRLDVYACSPAGNRAFVQKGNWAFEDRTDTLGLTGLASPSCSFADVDADGHADILAGGVLLRWAGGKYEPAGRLPKDLGTGLKMAVFADVNRDGWPDVVASKKGFGLVLLINPGQEGGAFEDASAAAGLDQPLAGRKPDSDGFCAAGDWNGDGRCDLYLGAGRRGYLLAQDDRGRFAPIKDRLPLEYASGPQFLPGLTGAGQFAPIWRGDSSDLAVPTESGFVIATHEAGTARDITSSGNEIALATSRQLATLAEDLDMDGWVDLYTIAWDPAAGNTCHTNRGYGSFQKTELYNGAVFPGQAHRRGAWGVASADFDDDGDNDLVLCGLDGQVTALPSRAISLQTPTVRASHHAAKVQQSRILAIRVTGRLGVCGAVVQLHDAQGRIVHQRAIGSQHLTGCRGPDAVNLAVREPGEYRLTVRYSDGAIATQVVRIDASAPKRMPLLVERPKG